MTELTERFYRNKKRCKSHLDLPLKRESRGNHKVTGTHCSRSNFLIIKYLKAHAWDLKPLNENTNETMAGELFWHLKTLFSCYATVQFSAWCYQGLAIKARRLCESIFKNSFALRVWGLVEFRKRLILQLNSIPIHFHTTFVVGSRFWAVVLMKSLLILTFNLDSSCSSASDQSSIGNGNAPHTMLCWSKFRYQNVK